MTGSKKVDGELTRTELISFTSLDGVNLEVLTWFQLLLGRVMS